MIVVGFWKILGVYIFYIYRLFLYFGLDHRAVVMLPVIFVKSKVVILIEK